MDRMMMGAIDHRRLNLRCQRGGKKDTKYKIKQINVENHRERPVGEGEEGGVLIQTYVLVRIYISSYRN